ncbi:hypothetical protein Nepgr_013984 [Nepenthes gracilis]|uniref:RING-type domain-containing protein n=1 Tax=Nepenthes gracilis TaxID=150966 RepID=A0AAD3SJ38_NEPGR|nr:hypothetical protein Nepgr_013984 [Nepenthes gracilis]
MSGGNGNLTPTPGISWLRGSPGNNLPLNFSGSDSRRSSGSSNLIAPSAGNRWTGWRHGSDFPRSSSLRVSDERIDPPQAWHFEESTIGIPINLTGFPYEPYAPTPVVIFDNRLQGASLRPVEFAARDLPPRYIGQRATQMNPISNEESKLNKEEQGKVLKMLKKEIYGPTTKMLVKRVSSHYRNIARDPSFKVVDQDIDEDVKRCAVCLDDFELRNEVTATPCRHLFHEECIVPWVKSHGQCPVCRSSFFKQT